MLTKGIEVQKYIRASAGRAGLNVVFENTNQPRHDGKTIYLPRITDKTTDEDLKQLMASVDHEVAHDRFSSFDILKEIAVDPKGILMFTWNFLEDSRVNAIEAVEYKGFRDNWDDCSSSLVEEILTKAATQEPTPVTKITTAMLCWESRVSASLFPTIELVSSKFNPDKEVTDVLNNYANRLLDCHQIYDKRLGTKATYDLAFDILTELSKGDPKEKEEQEEQKKEPKKGTGNPVEGTKEEKKDEGTVPTEKPSEDKEEGKEEKEQEDKEYKIIKVVLTKEDLENYSLTMPEDGKRMGKVGINFDPVDLTGGSWDLTDYKDFIVVDYPKNRGNPKYLTSNKHSEEFMTDYKSRVEPKLVDQENFAQQVRKLIQIRAKVQRQYGVKKGKLDQSRLSRICFNAPGFNERVFKNKIDNKVLDAAITVLIDMSGSMSGDKAYYALASTILLNEVCGTLNIPLEILGFTDGYASHEIAPVMFIYKSFNDLKVSTDQIKDYFALSSAYMIGNPDGENILWANDRLIRRKEKKKLMIVMSDGSPAASKSSYGVEAFTLKVIKEIEDLKKINIYGLGLCATAVTEYYKANSVVWNPAQIPSTLLSLIEKRIINV